MCKTLVKVFHPFFDRAKANGALAGAATEFTGATVVDMYTRYPDGKIDVGREIAEILAADRIVFQFPIYWYSVPSLMKEWLDQVLTIMFYVDYENSGSRFEGTPILFAATAGNVADAYTATGNNRFSVRDLFLPLYATAHRCGLPVSNPFVVYEADRLDDISRKEAALRYGLFLQNWEQNTMSPRQNKAA